jgi:hypothetical protein
MSMKVTLAVVAALLIGVLIQRGVASEPRTDMPPGVETSDWIRLTDNSGFLVVPEKPASFQPPGGRQVLTGHFFAKRNGQWFRLNVAPVGAVVQTN